MKRVLIRLCQWLCERTAAHRELLERHQLLDRPWEEDLLHWSHDGQHWRLHGHVLPPPNRRRRSTTRTGWCPATTTPSSLWLPETPRELP